MPKHELTVVLPPNHEDFDLLNKVLDAVGEDYDTCYECGWECNIDFVFTVDAEKMNAVEDRLEKIRGLKGWAFSDDPIEEDEDDEEEEVTP